MDWFHLGRICISFALRFNSLIAVFLFHAIIRKLNFLIRNFQLALLELASCIGKGVPIFASFTFLYVILVSRLGSLTVTYQRLLLHSYKMLVDDKFIF